MLCLLKRTQRMKEQNAKIFEMRAASPGESELEYEDIESSEMDNDNNDDIKLKSKSKSKMKNLSSKKRRKLNQKLQQQKMNDIETVEDDSSDEDAEEKGSGLQPRGDDDIFSDSTDDGMSMERMREEYYKSQTLTKRFTDLLDDIRDILRSKQKEVQHKFTKKKQMIVVPMAMPQPKSPSQSQINIKLKGANDEVLNENIAENEDMHEIDNNENEDAAQHSVESGVMRK